MLDTVKSLIDSENVNDLEFSEFYLNYIMKIQDMDIDNEILPLVKLKTTSYLSQVRKIERERKKRYKKKDLTSW